MVKLITSKFDLVIRPCQVIVTVWTFKLKLNGDSDIDLKQQKLDHKVL